MPKDKPYNGGQWTKSRFHSFVAGALRGVTSRWGPIAQAKKNARVRRGFYLCNACKQEIPATLPAVYKSGKKKGKPYRRKNALVDHVRPIVDPVKGFQSWDEFISNLFCELDNLQVLCHECHQKKCQEERQARK